MAQKSVLVTGASGFLGREVVKAFDLAGWKVIGTGLTRANPPAILKVDLTSEKEIEKVLDDVK
jgi:S-adenosylmethionine synthetase